MWKIICSWQLSWWLSGVKGEEPGLNHLDFKLELPVETNIHPSRRLQWGLIEILTVHLLKHTNFYSFHIHTFMNYKYKLHFQSNLVQIWRNFWKLEWDAFKKILILSKQNCLWIFENVTHGICSVKTWNWCATYVIGQSSRQGDRTPVITDPVIWRNNNNYFRSDRFPAIWRRSQSINWQYFNTKM